MLGGTKLRDSKIAKFKKKNKNPKKSPVCTMMKYVTLIS